MATYIKILNNNDIKTFENPLNKLESSNKFGKAVFHGNSQEFHMSTKEEQLIADGCKRLIENAIICWNYLYLSKKMNNVGSDVEKDTMTKTIKNGSVITWQHINLQGEYDFSEENFKNPIRSGIFDNHVWSISVRR